MNEEFVPFELAKKLKEKGFREPCGYVYNYKRKELEYKKESTIWNNSEYWYAAPTISQVLKWLREEKVISVEPYASASGWRVTICKAYHQDRCDAGGGTCLKEEVIGYNDGGAFEKYEEAAIAGIEYCLDNLI